MRKMRQRAKYAVIAYSHKTDMPNYSTEPPGVARWCTGGKLTSAGWQVTPLVPYMACDIQGCSQDQQCQDQDQDHSSQDQDQDRKKSVSSALETKTEVSRTTSLVIFRSGDVGIVICSLLCFTTLHIAITARTCCTISISIFQ